MSLKVNVSKHENTLTFSIIVEDIHENPKACDWLGENWNKVCATINEKINEWPGKEVDDANEEDTEEEDDDNKAAECTCPNCGCHEFEVIQRLGEVTLCPETVTIDKRGNVDIIVKDDPDAFYDAEVMDEYWRCSNCGKEIVDEDFTIIL